MELQSRLNELKRQGLGLAAISYDTPAVLADFTKRRGITFPLLSDPGSDTIKKYGILNTTVAPNTSNYGIPVPGTFILNRRGVVTSRFFESAYQERNTVSTILLNLGVGGSAAAAARHTTDHLEMTTYASDQTVAPGTVFSLILEMNTRAGIHVYAPGASGYKVIALTLEPVPWLKLQPMQFPASEIYIFKPLNERVPIYQKPFRLVQELNLEASREAQAQLARIKTLTIKGTVDYQACDDKVCFNPVSVPVSWTVNLRTLDTERANISR